MNSSDVKLSTALNERTQLEGELKGLVKKKANLEMNVKDTERKVLEDKSTSVSGKWRGLKSIMLQLFICGL